MRSRDTDQMIKVSKAMKVLKRESTSGKCQLTWSDGERKFDGRKAAFSVGFDCLLFTEANSATCLDCLRAGNVEIRLRCCGEVLGRGRGP